MDYNEKGDLESTGYLRSPFPNLESLESHLKAGENVPFVSSFIREQMVPHQEFHFTDDHFSPLKRGRLKYCTTHGEDEWAVLEKLEFDADDNILVKETLLQDGPFGGTATIRRKFSQRRVEKLEYPNSFILRHTYNKLGQLVALGTPENPEKFAKFTYTAQGNLETEHITMGNDDSTNRTDWGYLRRFSYNSPGYLQGISDPFLMETVTYTEDGYGQQGFGDGIVMKTMFNSTWIKNADPRWFQLTLKDEHDNYREVCINALKRTGYLSENLTPQKQYKPLTREGLTIPSACRGFRGLKLAEEISRKQPYEIYGHKYKYGNHQELTKAKFFSIEDQTSDLVSPLQPHVFHEEISGVSLKNSETIWTKLVQGNFIIPDEAEADLKFTIGKEGLAIENTLRSEDDMDINLYARPIGRVILKYLSKRRNLTLPAFQEMFIHWTGLHDQPTTQLILLQRRNQAEEIYKTLSSKKYIPPEIHVLKAKFREAISPQNIKIIPEILNVLLQHFENQLGVHPGDMESYEIDGNGNHRKFYLGMTRYELEYERNSNRVTKVKTGYDGRSFEMKYDNFGNVVSAAHKGIKRIKYDPVSQRTTQIDLEDGRTLRFWYDCQGERVLKRVYNADSILTSEIRYTRDKTGNVLMDQRIIYSADNFEPEIIETVYIYGPRGLLGFIRNGKKFSVMTDHQGSVRLVLGGTNGRTVMASYDYLPYGALLREFGNNKMAKMTYLFTGKEWDEETYLYNFHARMYDPIIGRFFQLDPKSQYPSPYKYGGNSPISMVDPEGEFVVILTLCLLSAAAGAYLGAAAANNRWSPLNWDWKSSRTYFGLIGGSVAGAFLPLGFGASVGTISAAVGGGVFGTVLGTTVTVSLGVGGAYLSGAASFGWNLAKWRDKLGRPEIWNAFLGGFSTGSGLVGGFGVMKKFADKGGTLEKIAKLISSKINLSTAQVVFYSSNSMVGVGVAYMKGVAANDGKWWGWKWDEAATYLALIDGFDSGSGWTQNFLEMGYGISRLHKRLLSLESLKEFRHPLWKTTAAIGMGYIMGAQANNNWDITEWENSFSTYEGIINGVFFGKDLNQLRKQFRKSTKNAKASPKSKVDIAVAKKFKKFAKKIENTLAIIKAIGNMAELNKLINKVLPGNDIAKILSSRDRSKNSNTQNQNQLPTNTNERTEALNSKTQSDIEKWELVMDELRNKQKEILVDDQHDPETVKKLEEDGYFSCSKISRRRKRTQQKGRKCAPQNIIETFMDNKKPKTVPEDTALLIKVAPERKAAMDQVNEGTSIKRPDAPQDLEDLTKVQDSIDSLSLLQPKKKHKHKNKITESDSIHNDKSSNRHDPQSSKINTPDSDNALKSENEESNYEHSRPSSYIKDVAETMEFTPSQRMNFAQMLAVTLKEIPLRALGDDSFLLFGIRGLLDGLSKTSKHLMNKVLFSAIEIDMQLNIDGEKPLQMFHAFYVDVETSYLSLKSFVLVDELKHPTLNPAKGEESTRVDLDSKLLEYFSKKLRLELPDQLKRNKLHIYSELFIFYKEAEPRTTRLLQMWPEISPNIFLNNDNLPTVKFMQVEPMPEFKSSTLDQHVEDFNQNFPGHQEHVDLISLRRHQLEHVLESAVEKFNSLTETIANAGNRAPDPKESGFQGYVYFLLKSAFEGKFHIDLFAELIAGKGLADIMGVIKTSKNSWDGIPFIMELKYNDQDTPKDAISQVDQKGYYYNMMLRTVSKFCLVFGVNPLTQKKITSTVRPIPERRVFSVELFHSNPRDRINEIVEALQHLHATTPNRVFKSNRRRYASSRVLGSFSRVGPDFDVLFEKHNAENPLNRIIVASKHEIIDVQFIESPEQTLRNMIKDQIVPNNLREEFKYRIGAGYPYHQFLIQVNPYGEAGNQVLPQTGKSVKITEKELTNTHIASFIKKISFDDNRLSMFDTITPDLLKLNQIDTERILRGDRTELFKFEENLKNLLHLFEAEADVHGYVHGLFERPPYETESRKIRITDVSSEDNSNNGGYIDLLVRAYEVDADDNVDVNTQALTGIEIKLIKNQMEDQKINEEIQKAVKQNEGYGPFRRETAATSRFVLTLVLNKAQEKLHGDLHEVEVTHTSVASSLVPSDNEGGGGRSLRRKREANHCNITEQPEFPNYITSGASSICAYLEYFPVKFFSSVLQAIQEFVSQCIMERNGFKTSDNEDVTVQCIQGALNGDSYEMSGITCKHDGNQINGEVLVFYTPKLALVMQKNSEYIEKDNYRRESCAPIQFNGTPSVMCAGERTEFVFTPSPSYFSKMFDNVDAQLMLGAVVIKKLASLWEKINGRNENMKRKSTLKHIQISQLKDWESKFKELEKFGTEFLKSEWWKPCLTDLYEQIDSVKKLGDLSVVDAELVEIIEEKLDSLWEDMTEEMEFRRPNLFANFDTEADTPVKHDEITSLLYFEPISTIPMCGITRNMYAQTSECLLNNIRTSHTFT